MRTRRLGGARSATLSRGSRVSTVERYHPFGRLQAAGRLPVPGGAWGADGEEVYPQRGCAGFRGERRGRPLRRLSFSVGALFPSCHAARVAPVTPGEES